MADYILGSDASFQAWLSNIAAYANASLAALGLVVTDMISLIAAVLPTGARRR